MSIIQLPTKNSAAPNNVAILNLGFRPFFLGASIFSILTMLAWALYYAFIPISISKLTPFQWHSHEMLYGYTFAVIAGFLLTAVMNWTGVQTLHGFMLAVLAGCWGMARVSLIFGDRFIAIAAVFDLLFGLGVCLSIAYPILKVRQWRQLGVLSKVIMLGAGNLLFYLQAFGLTSRSAEISIYGALYIILGLILVIGNRVVPPFIINGVPYETKIRNPVWASRSSLIFFVIFFVNQLFLKSPQLTAVVAAALFLVMSARLYYWYTRWIWHAPLLWGLYLAFVSIAIGFLLDFLAVTFGLSPFLAIHAYAVGGIGFSTLSMMSRVTLGHTGRMIKGPPATTSWSLRLLVVAFVLRVIFPLFLPAFYQTLILLSQVFWISAFGMYLIGYSHMLTEPRVDGRPG